jgi:hypothetical protein
MVARGRREHPLDEIGCRTDGLRPDEPRDLAKLAERRRCVLELPECDSSASHDLERGAAIEKPVRGSLPQDALGKLRGGPRVTLVERDPRATELRRSRRAGLVDKPAASFPLPCRRLSSASPTSGAATQAGRELEKSSSDDASIASAFDQCPRQRCTAPYSARQKASM